MKMHTFYHYPDCKKEYLEGIKRFMNEIGMTSNRNGWKKKEENIEINLRYLNETEDKISFNLNFTFHSRVREKQKKDLIKLIFDIKDITKTEILDYLGNPYRLENLQ